MNTWHDRLELALQARNRGWDELVSATKLKKPSVYAWKPNATKRSTMMNGDNAARVCEFLRISPLWLFYEEGPSGLGEPVLRYPSLTSGSGNNHRVTDSGTEEATVLRAFRVANDTAKAMLLAQANAILEEQKNKAQAAGK